MLRRSCGKRREDRPRSWLRASSDARRTCVQQPQMTGNCNMNFRARIAFVLAVAVLLICGESQVLAQAADDGLKRFNDSIVQVPPSQGPHGPEAAAAAPLNESARNKTLQLHFGLASQNIEELKARVAKGEIVSPDELSRRYSGNAENAKKLTAWLSQQGFTSIETTPDNTSVYAKGTVAQIREEP